MISCIGVGNLLMGDGGVGIQVVNELRKKDFPPNIEVADAMTTAFLLIEYLDGRIRG